LGTGGGIQLALTVAQEENVIVLNGDTMFNVDLNGMQAFHTQHQAATTLALKEMHAFDRYGVVNTDENNCIVAFEEKRYMDSGLINGGIYVINRKAFLGKELPEHFSFEKHYLELFVREKQFYGFRSDGYFIDIGIPEDYNKAQIDLAE
jgi:D-glycero-alpha-D-manno-heptose 1-phosphate guanylyltransferase